MLRRMLSSTPLPQGTSSSFQAAGMEQEASLHAALAPQVLAAAALAQEGQVPLGLLLQCWHHGQRVASA